MYGVQIFQNSHSVILFCWDLVIKTPVIRNVGHRFPRFLFKIYSTVLGFSNGPIVGVATSHCPLQHSPKIRYQPYKTNFWQLSKWNPRIYSHTRSKWNWLCASSPKQFVLRILTLKYYRPSQFITFLTTNIHTYPTWEYACCLLIWLRCCAVYAINTIWHNTCLMNCVTSSLISWAS